MADADLLPDDETEEDLDLLRDVGTPVEQSGEGPAPTDIEEIGAAVAPLEGPDEAPPDAVDVTTGLPPAAPPVGSVAANNAASEELATRQGEQDVERARIDKATSDRMAAIAQEADDDARLEHADYLQRRQTAEQDLDTKTKAYGESKLVDPSTKNKGKAVLSVIFGGLGAAFRSAGGGDSGNHALEQLQKKWHDDTEIQKANIAALKDNAVMARTRLNDVDEGRNRMRRDADARLLSKYNVALRQGESQLKDRGISQAQIDADGRIVKLRQGQAVARAQALKDEDAHALKQAQIAQMQRKGGTPDDLRQAQIRVMNARAALLERKTKGGGGKGGGGAAKGDAAGQVADYLVANPGDIGGAQRLAGKLGVDDKKVDKLVNQTKATGEQNKAAEFGQAGIRAVSSLEGSKYTPTDGDIQKWLNNQRDVYLGQAAGSGTGVMALIGGKAAGGLQSVGALAKSEVEGLSPDAQKYFADVRRLMEPLGRAKSGAAISQNEWVNFFNQYGPQSSGGYAAARKDLEDALKLSGVAGRSLSAQPTKAGAGPAKAGGTFVPGQTRKLPDGRTVRITSADGDYVEVSAGRKPMGDIKL